MNGEIAPLLWALTIFQAKHFLTAFVLQPRYALRGGERYVLPGRLIYALLHALGSFPAILLLAGWRIALPVAFVAELLLVYHLVWARDRLTARGAGADPSGSQVLFGLEQFLHQLFYLAAIALIV